MSWPDYYEEFHRRFEYDPKEGELYYRVRCGTRCAPGDVVGSRKEDRNGMRYIAVTVYYKQLYAHQIIWVMLHGDIPPGLVVDHKDGNGWNNRERNLRAVPQCVNRSNSRVSKRNTSGATGVFWEVSNRKWRARRTTNGVRHELGVFVDKADAVTAVKAFDDTYGIVVRKP